MEFSVQQIADFLQAELIGDSGVTVHGISKIEEGKEGTLAFLANPQYCKYLDTCKASALLISRDLLSHVTAEPTSISYLVVEDAYQSFASLLQLYTDSLPQKQGIDKLASIAADATIGNACYVGDFAFIGEQVKIGNNVKIYPQVYVGDGVSIGDGTTLFPGVKVYAGCEIGAHCVIHSGAVIGADGFGFAVQEDELFKKVPQLGNVVIEDHVEIGANTTIDRATMGSTVIRKGAKLDNLIQIAHNVEIGENSGIAAQAGIAGSSKIGKACLIGGQVGVSGHIKIGNHVKVAAQSGIPSDVEDDSVLQGSPVMDRLSYQKSYVVYKKLPDLQKQIGNLEKRIAICEMKK